MLLALMLAAFLAAVGLIGGATIFGFRFLGMALNPVRPHAQRVRWALAAAGCLVVIVGATAAGFAGVTGLMYRAQLEER